MKIVRIKYQIFTDLLLISGDVKVDCSLSNRKREYASYVEQIKNPIVFRVGDVKVRFLADKHSHWMIASVEMIASM